MAGSIKLAAPSGGSVTLNAVDTANNFVMSVPAAAGILINADSATGAAQLPVGTTAQRPASPVTGQLRYNSTTASTEVYNGTSWGSLGGYSIQYLVVAGGGSGGSNQAGGGGGGGVINSSVLVNSGTAFSITIGAGGSGSNGSNTTFGSLTAIGGGRGGGYGGNGSNGGSGGGGGYFSSGTIPGSGTTNQGFAGAYGQSGGSNGNGGGGGGAGKVGNGLNGGDGLQTIITGNYTTFYGGGGGSCGTSGATGGGAGGGGAGGAGNGAGTAGTANTGGGGGADSAAGGSGVVLVAYQSATQKGTGGTVTTYTYNGLNYYLHTFTTSGTFTA